MKSCRSPFAAGRGSGVFPLAMFCLAAFICRAPAAGVIGTKHDLSAAGPGDVHAVAEKEVCNFCHTPHRALEDGPLWNHQMSVATYIPYSSSTLHASVGQPTGSSRLCLSCHDGTVALGGLHNSAAPVPLANGIVTMADVPGTSANLGTDLRGHHPVSFVYDAALAAMNGRLKNPSTLDSRVKLENQQVQCTSCHDPHNDDFGNFLAMDNSSSALCLACHDLPRWTATASHAVSAKSTVSAQVAAISSPSAAVSSSRFAVKRPATVASHGCDSCHASHRSGSQQSLLASSIPEQNCFTCHNGTVAAKNIQTDFNKISGHSQSAIRGEHVAGEDILNAPRHATCVDCHDPHGSNPGKAVAPNASGAIAGVPGVSASGAVLDSISKEYELCFRCHGDSISRGAARVSRQLPQTNTRLEFAPSNRSFHPVVAPGRNTFVPSLMPPWTTASYMYCTDCHNNDQGPKANGQGANGPHGSQFTPLLERQLELTDDQFESPQDYALCYKCHSRSSILADQSFRYHKLHVVDQRTACTTCHDSHGSTQPHLINFNTTYVLPGSMGPISYRSEGVMHGTCTLKCHGVDHNNSTY